MKPYPSYLGLVTLPADSLLPSAAIHPAHIGAKGTLFIFIHNRHTEIIFNIFLSVKKASTHNIQIYYVGTAEV